MKLPIELAMCGPFIAKDGKVKFKNRHQLFGDDPDDTEYETFLTCVTINGNYGEVLSAQANAEIITKMLNSLEV